MQQRWRNRSKLFAFTMIYALVCLLMGGSQAHADNKKICDFTDGGTIQVTDAIVVSRGCSSNVHVIVGDMATQTSSAVAITGGTLAGQYLSLTTSSSLSGNRLYLGAANNPVISVNGQKGLSLLATTTGVDWLEVTTGKSGTAPLIKPNGATANQGLNLTGTGTGAVTINGIAHSSAGVVTGMTYDTAGASNVWKINGTTISSIQGNQAKVQTSIGTTTSGHVVIFDVSGNTIDSGTALSGLTSGGGGGSGTVNSGLINALGVYASAGTAISGTTSANATLTSGALTLGSAGVVGSLTFGNATSGTVKIQPVTGALGTVTASIPAATDTLVGKATTDTFTNKTFDTAGTGNSFKIAGTAITAIAGNSATAATTTGSFTSGNLTKTDASHNVVDAGVSQSNQAIAGIVVGIDGQGSAIATGIVHGADITVPFACTINHVRLLADQSGSIVVNIWKDTYANYPPTVADKITSTTPPTISSATKSEDTTLTSWTTSVTAGDTLRFNVDSVTTITYVTLIIYCNKT